MPVFDYTKTMMMKLYMAEPDGTGGSKVYCDFDRALDIVKQTDALTLGVQKIIYLVGWQFNGHDDKYPAFNEVNPALQSQGDSTPLESMLRLVEEAKKYNTVISVHINFADAYDNSPLADDYRKNNALIRGRNGRPAAIEKYNGLPCYKVSYKEEWESGLFHKRMQDLFDIFPLKEAGTVHIDNFQCYVNRKPAVDIKTMQFYRKKMIDCLAERGVDITSEFTYREGKLTALCYGKIVRDIIKYLYPINTLGQIPAVWWVDKMKKSEMFRYYPEKYAGGVPKGEYGKFLYGNIHGEELWRFLPGDEWHKEFLYQFAAVNIPYFFLSGLQKERLAGHGKRLRMIYKDGTVSYLREQKISKNGVALKVNDDLLIPVSFRANTYIGYSKTGCNRTWQIPFGKYTSAKLSEISANGLKSIGNVEIKNDMLTLNLAPGQGVMVEFSV